MSQQKQPSAAIDKTPTAIFTSIAGAVAVFAVGVLWYEDHLKGLAENATLKVDDLRVEDLSRLAHGPVPVKTFIAGSVSPPVSHDCSGGLVAYSYGKPVDVRLGESYAVKIHSLGFLGDQDSCGVILD